MKRAGFTMIELIFVIVILGILAAVALPKFIGVSEQAEAGRCNAFVGTLNRTVGPALWSDSILNRTAQRGEIGHSTSVLNDATAASIQDAIQLQVAIPDGCLLPTTTGNEYGADFSLTLGSGVFDINFTDGNVTSSPAWTWTKTN